MKSIKIITRNGKKLQLTLDTAKDEKIYEGWSWNPEPQRWTNVYVHQSKKENHFYLFHQTRWQNEEDFIELVSKERALEFLSGKALGDDEILAMKKYGLPLEEA